MKRKRQQRFQQHQQRVFKMMLSPMLLSLLSISSIQCLQQHSQQREICFKSVPSKSALDIASFSAASSCCCFQSLPSLASHCRTRRESLVTKLPRRKIGKSKENKKTCLFYSNEPNTELTNEGDKEVDHPNNEDKPKKKMIQGMNYKQRQSNKNNIQRRNQKRPTYYNNNNNQRSLPFTSPSSFQNVMQFNSHLSNLSKRSNISPIQLEKIVFHAQEQYENILNGDGTSAATIKPDVISYTIVIDAYSKHLSAATTNTGGNEMTNQNRGRGRTTRNNAQKSIHPNIIIERAEYVLSFMKRHDILPNTITYNALLSIYAKAGETTKALKLFDDMKKKKAGKDNANGDDDCVSIAPDSITYQNVILSLARCSDYHHHHRREHRGSSGSKSTAMGIIGKVENLLNELKQLQPPKDTDATKDYMRTGEKNLKSNTKNDRSRVDVYTYGAIMEAYSRFADQVVFREGEGGKISNHEIIGDTKQEGKKRGKEARKVKIGAQQAEDLLKSLQDEYASSSSTSAVCPNTILLNSVLNAWSKSKQGVKGAQKADELLHWALHLYKTKQNANMKPDVKSYNSCLNAWAKSGGKDAPLQAERLLNSMMKNKETKDEDSGDEQDSRDDYDDMKDGIRPNVVSYTTVLDAYAKQSRYNPDAATRAEELLFQWEEETSSVQASLSFRHDLKKDMPNAKSYTTVINAHANAKTANSAELALKLLRHMEYIYDKTRRIDVKPTVATYSAVLAALAKSNLREAADTAESLLHEMERNRDRPMPNIRCYNSVIDAIAKSGELGAPQCAQDLLDRIEFMHEKRRVEVRMVQSTSKNGESDTNKAPKEGNIANNYNSGNERGGNNANYYYNNDIQPNGFTYGACISAWARSREHGKANMAQLLLLQMKKQYETGANLKLRPEIFHYNWVLHACSNLCTAKTNRGQQGDKEEQNQYQQQQKGVMNNEEQQSAFQIALDTYHEIKKSPELKPDSRTYAFFLKACNNAVIPRNDRNKLASDAFLSCCREGQLSNEVLYYLHRACSRMEYMGLVGSFGYYLVEVDDLPTDWSCNAR